MHQLQERLNFKNEAYVFITIVNYQQKSISCKHDQVRIREKRKEKKVKRDVSSTQ